MLIVTAVESDEEEEVDLLTFFFFAAAHGKTQMMNSKIKAILALHLPFIITYHLQPLYFLFPNHSYTENSFDGSVGKKIQLPMSTPIL